MWNVPLLWSVWYRLWIQLLLLRRHTAGTSNICTSFVSPRGPTRGLQHYSLGQCGYWWRKTVFLYQKELRDSQTTLLGKVVLRQAALLAWGMDTSPLWISGVFLLLDFTEAEMFEWHYERSLGKVIGSIWIVHLNASDVNVPVCTYKI